MQLFEFDGIIRITLEKGANEGEGEGETGLMIHEWFHYDPEGRERQVLRILDQIYQSFLDHPVAKVLVLTDKAEGCFSPRVQDFINTVQFPRLLRDTELRYVATVVDKSTVQAVSTELWEADLEAHGGFVAREFTTEAEARAWLAEIPEPIDS